MGKEYSRTHRVGDFLQQELAQLIQREVRDPRVQMVSITGVDVSRDLSHAKVFFTQLGIDDTASAKPITEVLNKAAGFLRSELARGATMRTVPRLHFKFDESVGRGRDMESLLREVREVDALRPSDDTDTTEQAPEPRHEQPAPTAGTQSD